MQPTKLVDLIEQSYSGIYAVINEQDCKVMVRYSVNVLRSITDLIGGFKDNSVEPRDLIQDVDKLKVVILEKSCSNLQQSCNKWNSYYRSLGYSFYKLVNYNKYSIVTTIEYINSNYYFVVKARSVKEYKVVGVFDSNTQLQEFIKEYYPNDIVVGDLVVATNIHTKELQTLVQ